MLATKANLIILLVEIILQTGIRRQLETQTKRHAETIGEAHVVLQIERPLVGAHLSHKMIVIVAIAIGDTKQAGVIYCENRPPVVVYDGLIYLVLTGLEGIIAGTSLSIAVGSPVVLVLQTAKQVVLTQLDIDFVGNHGSLGLGHIAISKQIAGKRPVRIMALTIAHHNLNHRYINTILVATGLVLIRVGATQGVMQLTELAIELGCYRSEAELGHITA